MQTKNDICAMDQCSEKTTGTTSYSEGMSASLTDAPIAEPPARHFAERLDHDSSPDEAEETGNTELRIKVSSSTAAGGSRCGRRVARGGTDASTNGLLAKEETKLGRRVSTCRR